MSRVTAVVAEDEPLLARQFVADLSVAWPELEVVETVGDGHSALARALDLRPDVVFLDIRMPGMDGLEVAEALAEDWPEGAMPPLVTFVTAYDQHAVAAFDRAAVDYLVKPVDARRLARSCERLKEQLSARRGVGRPDDGFAAMLERLGAQFGTRAAGPRLEVLQASVGNAVHLVPVADVVYLEAADKYVRVVTGARDYLVRTPMKQLLAQLDPDVFWQVHRGVAVRALAIEKVVRDEVGRMEVVLRGRSERLPVSRLYTGRFRGM